MLYLLYNTHTRPHTHTEGVKTPLVGPSDFEFPFIDSSHSPGARLSASSSLDSNSNRLAVSKPIVPSTSFEDLHSVYSDSGRGLGSGSPGNGVEGGLVCTVTVGGDWGQGLQVMVWGGLVCTVTVGGDWGQGLQVMVVGGGGLVCTVTVGGDWGQGRQVIVWGGLVCTVTVGGDWGQGRQVIVWGGTSVYCDSGRGLGSGSPGNGVRGISVYCDSRQGLE